MLKLAPLMRLEQSRPSRMPRKAPTIHEKVLDEDGDYAKYYGRPDAPYAFARRKLQEVHGFTPRRRCLITVPAENMRHTRM
jgi:hypothetical protein